MPRKRSMVDYSKCQPEKCKDGICLAAQACPHNVMTQEEPYEMPDVNPAMCVGCALCAQACPLHAIHVI